MDTASIVRSYVVPIFSLIVFVCSSVATAQTTFIYVNPDPSTPPGGDGLTWGTALRSIEEANDPTVVTALLAIPADVRLVLARGTYRPGVNASGAVEYFSPNGPPTARHATFLIHPGVREIRGGYLVGQSGGDTPLGGRSLLSGDIGVASVSSDNCYHVLVDAAANPSERLELRDLVISDGVADGIIPAGAVPWSVAAADGFGGGVVARGTELLLTDVTIRNCFAAFGGGLGAASNVNVAPAKVLASRLEVDGCTASVSGGGIYLGDFCMADILNARVVDNYAKVDAAGIYVASRFTTISIGNCLVYGNKAGEQAAGIYVDPSPEFVIPAGSIVPVLVNCYVEIVHCTIAFNEASIGGGVAFGGAGSAEVCRAIQNSIVHSNAALSAPDLYVGSPSEPNLQTVVGVDHCFLGHRALGTNASIAVLDPTSLGFIDAVATGLSPDWQNPLLRDFRLKSTSPCIDQANGNLLNEDQPDVDLDGNDSEPFPREFLQADESNQPPGASTREVVAGVVNYMPQIGVLRAGAGAGYGIPDMGAHEYRILLAD